MKMRMKRVACVFRKWKSARRRRGSGVSMCIILCVLIDGLNEVGCVWCVNEMFVL